MLLKPGKRHHGIIARDAGDRSEKRRQPALGDKRGDLGTEAAGPCSFVPDDATSGCCNRADQGIFVIRLEGCKVDDLCTDAFSVSAAANVSFTIAPQLINVTSRPSLRTKATSSGMASPLSSTSPLAAR